MQNAIASIKADCPSSIAHFQVRPDQRLRIAFLKESMSPMVRQRYFGQGWFCVEEAYELPAMMLTRLGLSNYRIEPGRYQAVMGRHFITIDV